MRSNEHSEQPTGPFKIRCYSWTSNALSVLLSKTRQFVEDGLGMERKGGAEGRGEERNVGQRLRSRIPEKEPANVSATTTRERNDIQSGGDKKT